MNCRTNGFRTPRHAPSGGRALSCVSEVRRHKLSPSRPPGTGPHPTRRIGYPASRRGTHCAAALQWVVAVVPPSAGPAARRSTRGRDDPEQGWPVLDQALGAAEPTGGEGQGFTTQQTESWAGHPAGSSGIYCLVLWIPRPHHLGISRFQNCRVGPGWYVYTGSAKRNLLPRLMRHLRRSKRLRWHIDYLRAVATLRQIWIWPWTFGGECQTNARIQQMPNSVFPLKGFGSSDCRCVAHLVAFPSEPSPPDHDAPLTYQVRGGRLVGM